MESVTPARRPLLAILTLGTLLALPASSDAASIEIGAVDCAAGGVVATLTNSGSAPRSFVVLRGERAIANVVVAPGRRETRTVPLAEGQAAQVTVRDGSSYVSSYVRRACGADAAAAPATSTTALAGASQAPFPAAPVVPGTGNRGSAAGGSDGTAADQSTGDVTLPEAARTWPLLLVAGLALVLAFLLAAGRLRRRQPERDAPTGPAARPRA